MKQTKKHTCLAVGILFFSVIGFAACQTEAVIESRALSTETLATKQETAAAVTDADIGQAQTWGGIDNVVSVKHLYFSEQPDAAALRVAREHDVGVVISLRDPAESDWDESGEAANLGMKYYNVPISKTGPGFSQKSMQTISDLVQQHRTQKILLHCSTGNRAAAWLAVHLVNDHGMQTDPAIALARKAGLTNQQMESRTRTYLEEADHES